MTDGLAKMAATYRDSMMAKGRDMSHSDGSIDKYQKVSADRKTYVDDILNSAARKKTVVAGPGTGKTFLFKTLLDAKNNCLTLTFVNALVEDLSLDLYGLSKVRTLHGFARGVLGTNTKVFPKLSEVIRQDAKILLDTDVDFDKIFHDRDDDNPLIDFYLTRKAYYDKYYGYSSIIYAAVRLFEVNSSKIPVYEQVLVDEFQDFNKLEVSLIDLLATRSPVLLAGDDDQALYGFKGASADHIRLRNDVANKDYASFTLPYCSRCTRVIVDAVNGLITKAVNNGNLRGRIDKQYRYFEDKKKDAESKLYPKIVYAQVYARQIPWFIVERMNDIASEQKCHFSSLVMAPTKVQCRLLVKTLREKGLMAIEAVAPKGDRDIEVLDGLSILMKDPTSNLGWRIAAKHFLSPDEFENLLALTNESNADRVSEMIDLEIKKKVEETLEILKNVKKGNRVSEDDLTTVLEEIGMDKHDTITSALYNRIILGSRRVGNPGLRKLPVKITTIQSSKGLSADFIFITYFDDRYFIKDGDKSKISDQDICNFIVSMTRAKKKVYLVSTNKGSDPTFLNWMDNSLIERIP